MTMLSVRVRSYADGNGREPAEVDALVDTGAIFTIVPRAFLESLGVTPQGRQPFRTVEGRSIDRDIGVAYLEVQGRRSNIPIPVIFGDAGDVPVLGVTALEILGFEFDPVRGELRPTEFLLLAAGSAIAGRRLAGPEEVL